jgi:hypothetical protein
MSDNVIYYGPQRLDLNLPPVRCFPSWAEIPEQIKKAMDADPSFANRFQLLETFAKRPAPGSNLFEQAKVARQAPKRKTLVHPPLRRHR